MVQVKVEWPGELCGAPPGSKTLTGSSAKHNDADLEKQCVLAGDREGFKYTRKNLGRIDAYQGARVSPRLDMGIFNDFDMCYVFPKTISKGTKEIPGAEVRKLLLKYFRARVAKNLYELNNSEKFHPVYALESRNFSKSMSRAQFGTLIKKLFFTVLEHIGTLFIIEEGKDRNENTIVRVRLTERGAIAMADYKRYPLQVSRHCTKYVEFREDRNFVPPYLPYEQMIENPSGIFSGNVSPHSGAGSVGISPPQRRVWQRYDRLSRPVDKDPATEQSDAELSLFRDIDRIRLLRIAIFEFINVEALIKDGWVKSSFPLKQPAKEQALQSNWANIRKIFSMTQPLDEIRDYFGEEIGMYYAWLGYYTKSLILPAIVGGLVGGIALLFDHDWSFNDPFHNTARMMYCIFIGIWSVSFFNMWTRREKILTLRWGIEQAKLAKVSHEENPHFRHVGYVPDPVYPDKFMRWFPAWRQKARKYFTTAVLALVCAGVTLLLNDDLLDMMAQLTGRAEGYTGIEDWIRILSPSDTIAAHAAHVVLVTSLLMKVYDSMFRSTIVWRLGEYENHQYLLSYMNSINFKLFLFKISGYFTVLFYLAFFKEYFNPCDDTADGRCLPRLSKQLMMFYVMDVVMIASQIGSPLANYMVQKVLNSPAADMPMYQYQQYLPEFAGNAGLTGEYLEKIIQFGYTSLFSMACPFLPLLGFLNNAITLRFDAYKLCTVFKRPVPRQADGLGIWDDLQKAMTFFGILSNVLLCTFATIGHQHTLTTKLTASLVLLLLALAMKDFVEYKLPSESPEYVLMKARQQVVDYEAMWGTKE